MILQEERAVDIATPTGPMRTHFFQPVAKRKYPAVILYSEIFQATGPIRRFAAYIAGHGYIVAVPEVYHELEPAGTVLAFRGWALQDEKSTLFGARSEMAPNTELPGKLVVNSRSISE